MSSLSRGTQEFGCEAVCSTGLLFPECWGQQSQAAPAPHWAPRASQRGTAHCHFTQVMKCLSPVRGAGWHCCLPGGHTEEGPSAMAVVLPGKHTRVPSSQGQGFLQHRMSVSERPKEAKGLFQSAGVHRDGKTECSLWSRIFFCYKRYYGDILEKSEESL